MGIDALMISVGEVDNPANRIKQASRAYKQQVESGCAVAVALQRAISQYNYVCIQVPIY